MTDEPDADATAPELAEIEGTMRSDFREYARSPSMQERYGVLLQAREEGAAPPPVDEVGAEIATIQERIRNDNQAYQADPEMQSRYLELLTAQETGTDPSGGAGTLTAADLGDPAKVLTHYEVTERYQTVDTLCRSGARDFATNMQALNLLGAEIIRDIGELDPATNFLDGFHILSDSVQSNIYTSLLSGAWDEELTATPAEIQTFIDEDDAGAVLVEEWGEDADFKLGVVKARSSKIFAGLSSDDTKQLEHFVTTASDAEWQAMLRQLSNPEPAHHRPGFMKMKGRA